MQAAIRKRFAQLLILLVLMGCALFVSAGRIDWLMAWVYLGIYVSGIAVAAAVLLPRSPDLIAERAEVKADAKSWDKWLALVFGLVGPVATQVTAGLNERFGWEPRASWGWQWGAVAVGVPGYALALWAMASNRFFSSVVRIQKDRGHVVVSAGPYGYVRHPGYVGTLAFWMAMPVMLGSVWALIPAGLTALVGVVRTALEDGTLRRELDGYEDYTRRVRYRLLPGVW